MRGCMPYVHTLSLTYADSTVVRSGTVRSATVRSAQPFRLEGAAWAAGCGDDAWVRCAAFQCASLGEVLACGAAPAQSNEMARQDREKADHYSEPGERVNTCLQSSIQSLADGQSTCHVQGARDSPGTGLCAMSEVPCQVPCAVQCHAGRCLLCYASSTCARCDAH